MYTNSSWNQNPTKVFLNLVRRSSPQVRHSPEFDEYIATMEQVETIRKFVDDMDAVLMENMYAGDQIQKGRIPGHYIVEYGVNNLYRYRHPDGYRSTYTIVNIEGVGVCPLILDIKTHAEYERIFGYEMWSGLFSSYTWSNQCTEFIVVNSCVDDCLAVKGNFSRGF